jgi:hypothetical protein
MSESYQSNGELVASDSTEWDLNGTRYRIVVNVRFESWYTVIVQLMDLSSPAKHDRIDLKEFAVMDENRLQDKIERVTESMKATAEERENAKDLDVAISV